MIFIKIKFFEIKVMENTNLVKCVQCSKMIEPINNIYISSYFRDRTYRHSACSLECKNEFDMKSLCQWCGYKDNLIIYDGKAYCHDRSYKGAFCTSNGLTHLESEMNKRIGDCKKNPNGGDGHYCNECSTYEISGQCCTMCKSTDIFYLDLHFFDEFILCYDCKEYVRNNKDNIEDILYKLNPKNFLGNLINQIKVSVCECCKEVVSNILIQNSPDQNKIMNYIDKLDNMF